MKSASGSRTRRWAVALAAALPLTLALSTMPAAAAQSDVYATAGSADGPSARHRFIPADQEEQFVKDAVSLGASQEMARAAVWDADLAATLPVRVVVRPDHEAAPRGASDGASLVTPDTATDGTCATGNTLGSWGYTEYYYNKTGNELWHTTFRKRWCYSASAHQVNSTYWYLSPPQFTSLGATAWNYKGIVDENHVYVTYGGYPKGGHKHRQKQNLAHCALVWTVCTQEYFSYSIQGNYDGSKIANWTS